MVVTVRIPGSLRELTGGLRSLPVQVPDAATVGDVLDRLAAHYPELGRRIRDEQGDIRRHVNVFIGDTNVRDTHHCATRAAADSEIIILPSISGG